MMNESFLLWIKRFNAIQIDKSNQYLASNHWMRRTMRKSFYACCTFLRDQQIFKRKVRKVVPVRCLQRLLARNERVVSQPQSSSNFSGHAGGCDLLSISNANAGNFNINVMNMASREFKFNLVVDVFYTLKRNYYNISSFKARKAYKMMTSCIHQWFQNARRANQNRQKVKRFIFLAKYNHSKNLLKAWRQCTKDLRSLKQKEKYRKTKF